MHNITILEAAHVSKHKNLSSDMPKITKTAIGEKLISNI